MTTARTPSPFEFMVESFVRGLAADAKARLLEGAQRTLDDVTQSTTRKIGAATVGGVAAALQATGGVVLLDESVVMERRGEVAVVLGRRESQSPPRTASAPVAPGRYRAVVVLMPEE